MAEELKQNQPAAQQANLPEIEQEILNFWQKSDAFKKSVEMRSPDNAYVFYDGPPFATGMPHYGHLLGSTVKDVVPRYWTMKGYRVERVWGWDCHGLPIENMIEKQLDIKGGKKGIEELGIATFNQACRAEVLRLDSEWEKIIDRLGRWVDMKHNYKTMDTSFMESVWWGFKQLVSSDLVYEGKRVQLYCSRCATQLSNFEVAMDNSYVSVTEPADTYKYAVLGEPNTFILAWSTTPWNKIATPALAVHPTLTYVKVKQGAEFYYLAESRVSALDERPFEILEHLSGTELTQKQFELHYDFFAHLRTSGQKSGVVVADEFVTAEDGTGVVTLAAYGEDDFRVMLKHDIQVVEHVDENGKMLPEVTPWAGLYLLKVNPLVNADLMERGLLYREESITHSVPTCYRCGTRLYHSPLPAWLINVQRIKDQLIENNESINWVPDHLKEGRFKKGLESAPDWNISRSRYWGTPMPIWRGKDASGKTVTRVVESIAELQEWAVDASQVASITDIHREFIDHIEVWVDDAKTVVGTRIKEVFDCWVESGSMPFAAVHYPFENREKFEKNYPAQFVSEYISQTRAWFYTMHVLSTAIFGKKSFENVLTTGVILAEDGSKMSKSKKNYPDPMEVINKYGVDSLRLYLMSSPVMRAENLNFNEKEVADIRRSVFIIWWNVLSFYLQFSKNKSTARPTQEPADILDQWLLSSIDTLTAKVTEYMDAYDVVRASRSVMGFVDQLSTWYLRLSRDRLRDSENTQAQEVFGYALYTLAQLIAPFAPFFAEKVHHLLVDNTTSIHHTDWPTLSMEHSFSNEELEAQMQVVRKVVELGHAARKEKGIKVRQPLALVTVFMQTEPHLEAFTDLLCAELNVKAVVWKQHQGDFQVVLETTLTPELLAEGQAREVVRQIQTLRRNAQLTRTDVATVALPDWPTDWESYIQEKTNSKLVTGLVAAIIE